MKGKKDEEIIEIPIKGEIKFGPNCNSIKIPQKDITLYGTQMIMDLLEEITGISYDAPLNWRFPGEKGILFSLEDYLIEILEKRFGMDVKICGFCRYHNIPEEMPNALKRAADGFCDKDLCPNERRAFGEFCCFEPSEWCLKEIPEEEKK